MNLTEAIESYIERKRSQGLEFGKAAQNLVAFGRHIGSVSLERVTAREVLAFLNGPKTSPATWEKKYGLLRGFFEFWSARGEIQNLPLPAKQKATPRSFFPHIYTHTEIRALLNATHRSQKQVWCNIAPLTLRTVLIFLYGTGALVGEAIRLLVDDVDLKKSAITIRGNRFNRSRTIPIGPDLRGALEKYLASRQRQDTKDIHFFLSKENRGLNTSTLGHTFPRLRRISGINWQDDATYQPRMHDLRHTFAVHRITGWIKHGADLNRMLPALAVYMGQAGLRSTEKYLSLTPERFRAQLIKLSSRRSRKRWRDDPELMKFLSQLTEDCGQSRPPNVRANTRLNQESMAAAVLGQLQQERRNDL